MTQFPFSNEALTAHVKWLSLEKFNRAFTHKASFNSRLRTTGGRFFPKDCHLDFNPKMAQLPEFDKIILHELTHYHLYIQKRGYHHQDAEFKQLLKAVGGLRYAPALTCPKWRYVCENCGSIYPRQRKIDPKKYRCGRCHGKLNLNQ